ncbi:MAG: hypothetical protein JNM07_09085 [Phycisphaerae bacterium]|nr:hypothetical protein [Phycisphaerae bacterium]
MPPTRPAPVQPAPACAVRGLIPMAHARDLEATVAFYASLGFECDGRLEDARGRLQWVSLSIRSGTAAPENGGPSIMFARAAEPVVPEQQAVLFYMYSRDVAALRTHLLASGLADGGAYRGQRGPNQGRMVVFDLAHPEYMSAGEIRVSDPDAYCILVGQLG